MNHRETALRILERVDRTKAHAHVLLQHAYQEIEGSEASAGFLTQLVKGTLQQRAGIDDELRPFLKKPLSSLDSWTRNILRLGAYEVLFLNNVPREVSVNQAVELAKKYAKGPKSGFVNAVLRNLCRKIPEASDSDNLSHPEWILRLWREQLGDEQTESLARRNNEVWPAYIRVNTLKTDIDHLRKQLLTEGVESEKGNFAADILRITGHKGLLHTLASFTEGLFTVQDESAALIGHLVDPQAGQTIIDLCSAPGGKSTHIAALMSNTGLVLSLDPGPRRLRLVRRLSSKLGITCIEVAAADGRNPPLKIQADRVIVDAPCSGLGTLGNKSDLRWNQREENLAELAVLQAALLDASAPLVRPGGRLIYSTCTINRNENEEIVEAFLRLHPEFSSLPCSRFLPEPVCDKKGYFRVMPHTHNMAGAFGAALERK